jgi:hypothetical protein
MVLFGAQAYASGNNSETTIHIIAPAANHNQVGKNGANCFTNKNAGIAIKG